MEDLRERVRRLEADYAHLLERHGHLDESCDGLAERINDVVVEIGRVPKAEFRGTRESVTDRLHRIEGTMAAADKLADEIKRQREQRKQVWTEYSKNITAGAAIVSAVGIILRIFGVGG